MAYKKIRMVLELSGEQRQVIQTCMKDRGWNMDDVLIEEEEIFTSTTSENRKEGFPLPRHQEGFEECNHCFCAPCVTNESVRQTWWPSQAQPPSNTNSTIRKSLYRRFWGMLTNCGAWFDQRYVEKKRQARRGDGIWHQREILPDCVVEQCRTWYPNVDKQPYMGHKWD